MIFVYRIDEDTFHIGKKIGNKIRWDYNGPYTKGWLDRWGIDTEKIPIGEIYSLN